MSSQIDLKKLFHSVGGYLGEKSLVSAPENRRDYEGDVEEYKEEPKQVSAPPLKTALFSDGIQNGLVLTYREQRPCYLAYCAAGVVNEKSRLVHDAFEQDLTLLVSKEDETWAEELDSGLEVDTFAETRPDLVARAALDRLRGKREDMERRVVKQASRHVSGQNEFVVVDGSLQNHKTAQNKLVSVVKTTRTRFLKDESNLWSLRQGWMSQRFKISSEQGETRYSCYLRLRSSKYHSWNYGLVRLETFDPDILENLAATALLEVQTVRSQDPRADVHLSLVRDVEKVLRAQRPDVFAL